MGLLVNIRESWANFLATDAGSGAAAFFSPAAPALPISIFTEKLKTIEQNLTDAQTRRGMSVVIVTVSARGAQNQMRGISGTAGAIEFKKIMAVARVYEAPKTNSIGLSCSDVAEAVAWFTRKFTPPSENRTIFALEDISLAPNSGRPDSLAYDVIYTVEGTLYQAPARP